MNKYLLLRDNKQTGPYSAQELATKGLKPYDLVWLDGKSAAWRYPSEMEELKAFAPAIEEQPYDRFYKRSSIAQEHAINAATQQLGSTLQQNNTKAGNENAQVTIPVIKQTATAQTNIEINAAENTPAQQPKAVEQTAAMQSVQTVSGTANQSTQQAAAQQTATAATSKVYVTLPAGMNASQAFKQKSNQQTVSVQQQAETPAVTEENKTSRSEVSQDAAKALEDRAAALALSVQQAAAAAKNKAIVQSSDVSKQAKSATEQHSGKLSDNKSSAKATTPVTTKSAQTSHTTQSGKAASFSTLINTKSNQEEKAPVIPINASARNHRMMMRGIVAACLLLGGIVIGMALTYSKQNSGDQAALDELVLRLQQRDAQQKADAKNALQATPNEHSTQISTAEYKEEKPPVAGNEHSAIPASKPVAEPKEQVAKAVMPVHDPTTTPPSDESGMKVSQAVVTNKEEPRPVRQADPEATREKLYQMIQVAASQFKIGVLGGISDLHFTVSNNSSFPLDEVELEIKYLGPEKRVVKVQRLLFSDLSAGSQKTLEAPRTSRGVSIDYVVTRIHSRALGIAHAGF
ncbi:hypothetical protein HHL16_23835 [Pseudoflavitalea sp. G-6-1-2]|uniref:hypothetical protein n=1 Tax=Pseudoflavitalea sp. G-6-1-2 TaxID=2728841 RepID=UPI00146E3AD6|nr:hypothetical protein [Pseudoflavitalea sp. G-6-1-2]NML23933.1 hypothetical protein [Pseudoflavitalea sp. G-6-1-2]